VHAMDHAGEASKQHVSEHGGAKAAGR
jgi:hypothetical protein